MGFNAKRRRGRRPGKGTLARGAQQHEHRYPGTDSLLPGRPLSRVPVSLLMSCSQPHSTHRSSGLSAHSAPFGLPLSAGPALQGLSPAPAAQDLPLALGLLRPVQLQAGNPGGSGPVTAPGGCPVPPSLVPHVWLSCGTSPTQSPGICQQCSSSCSQCN